MTIFSHSPMTDTFFLYRTAGSLEPAGRDVLPRRSFLRRSVSTVALLAVGPSLLATVLTACSDAGDPTRKADLDLSTDIGVLNYVYAVTQLEYDFYDRIVNNKFPGMLASEYNAFNGFLSTLSDARDDLEVVEIPSHRITDALLFRLGQIVDFADRTSIFTAAQTIEDAAASSFLAARDMLAAPDKATVVGDLATAAAARADTIRGHAVVPTPRSPADVMQTLAPYYLTTLTISHG